MITEIIVICRKNVEDLDSRDHNHSSETKRLKAEVYVESFLFVNQALVESPQVEIIA